MVVIYDEHCDALGGKHYSTEKKNLGNKLFIYSISRVAADILNCNLVAPENALIRREEESVNQYVNHIFPFKGIYDRRDIQSPVVTLNDIDIYNHNGIANFIAAHPEHKIMSMGYYSKYDYIKPHKDLIKSYYQPIVKPKKSTNDIVIMLRNSRVDGRFVLPDDYYTSILEKESFDNLYISLDHTYKHDRLLAKLQKYNPIFIKGSILEVFTEVTSFNKIIAAQGTFSFWACLLSSAEKIYWPMTNDGPNSNNDVFKQFVNLKVDDEPRYEFVDIPNIYIN